jgi:hypothetical protein
MMLGDPLHTDPPRWQVAVVCYALGFVTALAVWATVAAQHTAR